MIKTLGTRYPVLGRLRFGDKEPVMKDGQPVIKNGKPVMRPAKASVFRFTSDDEYLLKAVASHFGGTVTPWVDGEQAYSLTSESGEIECLLPPDPVDTAYELWGSGGCQRRCDGERCSFVNEGREGKFLDTADCLCLAEGKAPGDKADPSTCNVTVRIRILLPNLPGIGVWMGTSHSVYAAMELPAQVSIIKAATAHLSTPDAPVLVPAVLALDHREEKKPFEKYKRDFYVVSLRVRASMVQLDSLARSGGELNGSGGELNGSRPALEAGSDTPAAGNGANNAKPEERHGPPPVAAGRAQASKPATPPAPAGDQPADRPGGDGSSPVFIRAARGEARRTWPASSGISDAERESQLSAVVQEVLYELRKPEGSPAFTADDIAGPEEGNAVMEALRQVKAS